MIKKLLTLLVALSVVGCYAGETSLMKIDKGGKSSSLPKNVASIGLLSLGFYNISLKYERSLKPWCSVRLHGGMMIPHSSSVIESVEDLVNENSSTKMSNELWGWHIKPEFVCYPGKKGSPKGYYIGGYGKVDHYGLTMNVQTTKNEYDNGLGITRVGGGLIMGYQWLIANRVSIDFWFFGIGVDYYMMSASYKAKASESLSADDKKDIEDNVKAISADAAVKYINGREAKVDFPGIIFPCSRFGLSVGVAF